MKWYLNYKHSQELLIHLLAWVFLFCLPPMLIGRANERPGQEEMFRMMGPPLAMAMVFYLNYIWLVPQLLFNKRNKAYVLSNVAFCIGMLFFTHLWFELVNAYFHSTPPPPKNSMGFWGFLLFRLRDFILFGLIAALAATIRMSKKWHEAELGRQKAELKRIEAELKNLHNQINPHFLYNTLDTIYMLARINGEEKTMKMIQALSKYLRLSLSKGREIVTVEDELENVKSYMEIQQIRNENLFRYEIECAEELKTRWILKLILQPIVENAVKYGFCDIFEGGLIRISVTEQAGQLTFSVYNNGTPMEEQMAEKLNGLSEIPVSKMKDSFEDKKHGYGVINIITRLRLKYGEDVRFFYESDTNGTVCVIQIPDDGKENSEQ